MICLVVIMDMLNTFIRAAIRITNNSEMKAIIALVSLSLLLILLIIILCPITCLHLSEACSGSRPDLRQVATNTGTQELQNVSDDSSTAVSTQNVQGEDSHLDSTNIQELQKMPEDSLTALSTQNESGENVIIVIVADILPLTLWKNKLKKWLIKLLYSNPATSCCLLLFLWR